MWLDGLYMAEPFYAEFAQMFHHPEAFQDITQQFELLDKHARDTKTGLVYHGWDESKQQRWANKQTGLSPEFWARAMGWQMMALVDALSYYPENDPGRQKLVIELQKDAGAIAQVQDHASGLWYQVLDKPTAKRNYLESSASSMFVYSLAKGVRRGYLDPRYLATADRGYRGILKHFVKTGVDGEIQITSMVLGAGLGGNPYRDGSYEYYIGEKTGTNDPKGVGAFLLAAIEMENADNSLLGRKDTVLLDAWFNSQKRADAFGNMDYFHYKWNDLSNDGYSLLGHIFRKYGASTDTLYSTPDVESLRHAQVYIVVSPDTPAKNPDMHPILPAEAAQIEQWVRNGGVLMLLANDPANTDLANLNLIAERFGIHYYDVLRNHVVGTDHENGEIPLQAGGPIMHRSHLLYMKDTCAISVKTPAIPVITKNGDIFMATAKSGKGTVLAVVDPWLYNEYTDGRKLPPEFDNFGAGMELVAWILKQVPQTK